ncbi:hypothetical protein Ancab_022816 [Ancistrocladus abbreviatus]
MASHAALASSRLPITTQLPLKTSHSFPTQCSTKQKFEVAEFSGLRSGACVTHGKSAREATFRDVVAAQLTSKSGRSSEGLKLFDHFVTQEGFEPNHICFTTMLSGCNHAGFLDRVDLYARKGHLRKAKELMEEMPFTPNDVMLSSFLSSCNIYGTVVLARETAEDLFKM